MPAVCRPCRLPGRRGRQRGCPAAGKRGHQPRPRAARCPSLYQGGEKARKVMGMLRAHHKAILCFAAQKAEQASAAGSDAAFFKPAQIACPAGTALHVCTCSHVPCSAAEFGSPWPGPHKTRTGAGLPIIVAVRIVRIHLPALALGFSLLLTAREERGSARKGRLMFGRGQRRQKQLSAPPLSAPVPLHWLPCCFPGLQPPCSAPPCHALRCQHNRAPPRATRSHRLRRM